MMQMMGSAPGVRQRLRSRAARRADYLAKKLESEAMRAAQMTRIAQDAEKRAKEAETRSLFREFVRRVGGRMKSLFAKSKTVGSQYTYRKV